MAFQTKNPEPSNDMLIAIGRAIVEWNRLESEMEEVIWSAIGLHESYPSTKSRIITGTLSFGQKDEMIKRLHGLLPPAAKAPPLPSGAQLKELERGRNIIAHGSWEGGYLHSTVTKYSRPQGKDVLHAVALSDLEEFALKIRAMAAEYRQLAGKLQEL